MLFNLLMSQRGQMMPMGPMGSQNSILLWVIIGLLTLIIAYLWFNRRNRVLPILTPETVHYVAETDKIDVAMKLLSPNERIVVEALLGNGGEMLQKDIHYDLELSRVQAHRIVQALIQRDIVTVEDHYNTKKVRLAEWLIS